MNARKINPYRLKAHKWYTSLNDYYNREVLLLMKEDDIEVGADLIRKAIKHYINYRKKSKEKE